MVGEARDWGIERWLVEAPAVCVLLWGHSYLVGLGTG
jgi:hypothetical protein